MRSMISMMLATSLLAGSAVTAVAYAQEPATTELLQAKSLGTFGIDTSGMDKATLPGDDFYAFVNGTWAKNTPVPDDKSNYGMFTYLADLSDARIQNILTGVKDDPNSKVGRAYASYLDEATVEAKGLAPIQPWLNEIRGLSDKADYAALMAKADRNGIGGQVAGYVGQDDRHPDQYIYTMFQAGIGMPDRDYYLEDSDRIKTVREAYLSHLERVLTLAGETENVKARAAAILAFETEVAKVQWNRDDASDATKTYNKMTVDELVTSAPGFDFRTYLNGIGAKNIDSLLVSQPTAVTAIAKLIDGADLGVLKDSLIVRSMDGYSEELPKAVKDEAFAFYGTVLSGTPQQQPRWKDAVGFTQGALRDEVGKLYAAKYFPPEYKAEMNKLVKNVLAAMGRRIDGLAWMQPETKVRAKAKLANFMVKVGYPDQWRDYSGLEIRADDLFGNTVRSNNFEHDYNIGKLGTPVRKWEWGMSPSTVNAYANFGMMEVVFPAAILQPPFFDPKADPAVNYGGIGAVIGHEISHHFDDQGAKYDENGALNDWWTPEDTKAFEEASNRLVAQYDAYEPLPGEHVQGKFTLGENIGDLAGLTIAYDAWKQSLGGATPKVIDGYTGDQRFYMGWAQVWRRNYREANLSQRLKTDPHSPSIQRAWVVRNLDPWYAAYQVKPDAKLYLAPADRVKIW